MNEQEMREEIERLRTELAAVKLSRERLCDWLCQAHGFEPPTDAEIEEMMNARGREGNELLREILPPEMHDLILENDGAKVEVALSVNA